MVFLRLFEQKVTFWSKKISKNDVFKGKNCIFYYPILTDVEKNENVLYKWILGDVFSIFHDYLFKK